MIRYYFLLFVRNIRRQKLFSAINMMGLTAGIVSTMLIFLYVRSEMSHDRFHENAERIYRINQTFIWGENDPKQFASLGPGVAYALKSDIPEIEQVTRCYPSGKMLVTNAENPADIKSFDEKYILAVDSSFFDVFTFPLTKGNPSTALKEPYSVILTSSKAKSYFGTDDVVGKQLQITYNKNIENFKVAGVMNDVPDNSYITFDMLISMSTDKRIMDSNNQWLWTMFETYVLLDERATMATLQEKVAPLPKKYAAATLQNLMYQSWDDYLRSGKNWELFVQPLTSIHLHSAEVYNRINDVGSIKTIYVLIGVEIFIILLSCINFMNLSTAQYTRRIKESSLRQILGSSKYQLGFHFFAEAFMFCLLAAVAGVGIIQLLLPVFNNLTESHLSLNLFGNPELVLVLGGLIITMSVLSGSYPAIFLSRFSAVEAMKGKLRTGKQGKTLRNGLVTFQFAISMVLIVCTIVVFQQLRFLAHKDIGFNRENLLVIDRAEWASDRETFRHALENISGVETASWCTSAPPNLFDGDQFKSENGDKVVPLNYTKADDQYISTLGLKLKTGRNFSDDMLADRDRVILNETAVKSFGWTLDENVIGKKIEYPGRGKYEVIGVVGDFNYWALQSPIQPMALFSQTNTEIFSVGYQFMVLRIAAGKDVKATTQMIADVEKTWKKHAGDHPFQYDFVDEQFDQSFKGEQKFGYTLTVFAVLAILIACMGLLGMIIFTLEQRMKEIGIRKVVGASVTSIWAMMVKEYTLLILAAIVVSTPVCAWLLSRWLEDFNYRVTISPWAFVIAALVILATSLIITSYHVIRAAMLNPVNVLKDE